jgi:hypothetical protein
MRFQANHLFSSGVVTPLRARSGTESSVCCCRSVIDCGRGNAGAEFCAGAQLAVSIQGSWVGAILC